MVGFSTELCEGICRGCGRVFRDYAIAWLCSPCLCPRCRRGEVPVVTESEVVYAGGLEQVDDGGAVYAPGRGGGPGSARPMGSPARTTTAYAARLSRREGSDWAERWKNMERDREIRVDPAWADSASPRRGRPGGCWCSSPLRSPSPLRSRARPARPTLRSGGLFQLFNVSAGEAGALRILENYGANWNFGVKSMF
jgi:hypothetical protein